MGTAAFDRGVDMLPILFNTAMVRAILEGRKTTTRRLIQYRHYGRGMKDIPPGAGYIGITELGKHRWKMGRSSYFATPAYDAGRILYVRETWAHPSEAEIRAGADPGMFLYKADAVHPAAWGKWHPSIHMPKEAARIFLRVTDVRPEHLQDITEGQARAEGARSTFGLIVSPEDEYAPASHTAVEDFARIWDETIRSGDWDRFGFAANPWVWVYSFERVNPVEAQA